MPEIPENVVSQALEVRETGLCNMVSRVEVQQVAFDYGYYELVGWIVGLPRKSDEYYKLLEAMSDRRY